MAHDIEIDKNGTASFFAGEGKPAWHGLGTVIEGLATAQEALELSGLDWTVSLKPVQFLDEDGTAHSIPDRLSVNRSTDNRSLGIVSKGYRPFQNAEVFEFMDNIIDSGEANFTTAGSLNGGKRVFMTAKIGDTFEVAEDQHDSYLFVYSSHDGTKSLTAAVTTVRVVCQNTATLALRQAKNKWTLRHKATLEGKKVEAMETLGLTYKYQSAFDEEVKRLLDIEVSKDRFIEVVSGVLPKQPRQHKKNLDDLVSVWENEPTVKDSVGAGTGWGVVNAMSFWTNWQRESRSQEALFKSLTEGTSETSAAYMLNSTHKRVLALA